MIKDVIQMKAILLVTLPAPSLSSKFLAALVLSKLMAAIVRDSNGGVTSAFNSNLTRSAIIPLMNPATLY